MKIRDHISLRDICWFQTGGVADYFMTATEIPDFIAAIEYCRDHNLDYQVVGNGSRVLVSDAGFPGLVIQNRTHTIVYLHERSQIIVDSGTPLAQLAASTISQGYSGLEFLVGAWGTVGGAIHMNETFQGNCIGNYVRSATLLSRTDAKPMMQTVERDWFKFQSGESRLSRSRTHVNHPIILSVTFQLAKMNQASCMNRVNRFLPLRKKEPNGEGRVLKVFNSLVKKGEKSVGSGGEPLYEYDATQLRSWRLNAINAYGSDPNFIINQGVGISRDAASLIYTMQNAFSQHTEKPKIQIEFMGLWEVPSESQDASLHTH